MNEERSHNIDLVTNQFPIFPETPANGTYHDRLTTPPMVRPSQDNMDDVDGGVPKQGQKDARREPVEEQPDPWRKALHFLDHGHHTPRPHWQRSASRASPHSIVIFLDALRCQNGIGNKSNDKDNQETDGITGAKIHQRFTSGVV